MDYDTGSQRVKRAVGEGLRRCGSLATSRGRSRGKPRARFRAEREALIAQYAAGPARLGAALARVPAEAMTWRPAPGEWSAHEIVCHCADSETNSYARIRFLLAEEAPLIQGYDQDRWATALIRRLPDEAWAREGRHTESGRYTAEDRLAIYAEHLEGHARQIETNAARWRARS